MDGFTLPTILEQGLTPDIIDETDANDVFVGFYKYDATNNPNICALKRITKATESGKIITRIRFPFGQFDYTFDWDERNTITDWRHRDFAS